MDFRVLAQRGDVTAMECSGTAELDVILTGLGMSLRDRVCDSAEKIEQVLLSYDCPVTAGWATGRGWVRVEKVST